jgi:arginyl-tRNA synthetase
VAGFLSHVVFLSSSLVGFFLTELIRLKDKHQVVNCTDPALRTARLQMVVATGNAIKRALNILGIETLEKM